MASTSRTVKVKFDGDAKGLQRATKDGEREVDRFGKSIDKSFGKSGENASKSFGASLKKWFKGDGAGLFTEIGKSGGTVFGSGLLGALKTPILGPAIMAAFAGIAATVMPAAGALAAGGLVLGFGGGLAALGLVFAAQNEAVKKKWQSTLSQLGGDMRLLAKPFEGTLIGIAGIFERTVDAFNPHLAKAFAKMADPIEDFVDQGAKALEGFIPAIDPVTDAFNAVLDATGPALVTAVDSIAEAMGDLAASVEKNPEALADTVKAMGDLSALVLGFITTLNDVNTKFSDMTGGTSLVTVAFKGLEGAVRLALAPFVALLTVVGGVADGVNALKNGTDASGQSMRDAAANVVKNAQALDQTGAAAQKANTPVKSLTDKFAEQDRAIQALINSTFRLQGLALGLSGAQIGFQAALDSATESVKTNGRTLDINTAAGRANRTALNEVASSANAQTQAMLKAGHSNDSAGLAAERSRANFVKTATQMGLSKREAEKLADSMIAIPNVSREARLTAHKKDLDAKLADARTALKDPTLTKERRAKLNADIGSLLEQKRTAQAAIDSLRGKTVTVNIKYTSSGVNLTTPSSVGRRAAGGPTQPNRDYLLGERGPEIARFSGTGPPRILSAEQTRRELAGGSQPLVVENHIEIGGEVVRVVRTEIKQRDRDLKRTVKAG